MLPPGGADEGVPIIEWQRRIVGVEDGGGRFSDASDHGQRSGQFALPSLIGVQAIAAVGTLESVVATPDDVEESVGTAMIRIVIEGQQSAMTIEGDAVGIPKPS